MSVTDQELLAWCQAVVLEPRDNGATWPSGLWTAAEVLNYAIDRQNRFLRDTLLVGAWQDIAVQPTVYVQTLQAEWLATTAAAFTRQDTGAARVLHRTGVESVDLLTPTWRQALDIPLIYMEGEGQTRQAWLSPPPLVGGTLHLLGVALAAALTGTGEILSIPDECAPYLKYGILADMFGKEGRAHDGPRRDYCEARWREGTLVAKLLVEGLRV